MKSYILKACRRCGGDLAMDYGDWICLQCGRYSYVGLYGQPPSPADSPRSLVASTAPAEADSSAPVRGTGGHRGPAPGRKSASGGPVCRPAPAGALP